MSAAQPSNSANAMVAFACALFAVVMVGAAYAAVPLYRMFCQATGFGGVPVRVENINVTATNVPVEVRFDSNVTGLPWRFTAAQSSLEVKLGVPTTVHYRIENTSDQETAGIASYNVTPQLMAPYFSKLQCFCFSDQKLGPHQSEDLTVVFYVDPALLSDTDIKDARSVTLSYSFYPSTREGIAPVAGLTGKGRTERPEPKTVN